MATSFITINHVNGFWVRDSLIQVVCWGLEHTIKNSKGSETEWVKGEFLDHLHDCSQGIFVGFIDLELNIFLTNQERVSSFKDCIYKTKNYFESKGETISTDELNAFQKIKETRSEWIMPLSVSRINNILDHLEKLIDNKITSVAADSMEI